MRNMISEHNLNISATFPYTMFRRPSVCTPIDLCTQPLRADAEHANLWLGIAMQLALRQALCACVRVLERHGITQYGKISHDESVRLEAL